jgi:hypothetical protein
MKTKNFPFSALPSIFDQGHQSGGEQSLMGEHQEGGEHTG